MIKLDNLDLVLEEEFKDFVIKNKRGKQYFGIRKMFSNSSINTIDHVGVEYYRHLLNSGKTKSYAVVAALLLRQKAEGLKLKSKYVSAILEKEGRIRVDLTAPEVEDNQEEMLSLMVNAYKNERERFLHQFKENKELGITFTASASLSTYKKMGSKAIKFQLITSERNNQFDMNEEDFFDRTIKNVFDSYDGEIEFYDYSQNSTDIMEIPSFGTSYSLVVATVGKKNIILENMESDYMTKLQKEVNRHNTRIDIEETKELKKER